MCHGRPELSVIASCCRTSSPSPRHHLCLIAQLRRAGRARAGRAGSCKRRAAEDAGDRGKVHGVGGQPLCGRCRCRDSRSRRQRRRRGNSNAACSQSGRAAVLRNRRRRVHRAFRQGNGRGHDLRRARDGASCSQARPVHQRRQADEFSCRRQLRSERRCARDDKRDGTRAPETRASAMGEAVRAGDPARRKRLRCFAAPQHAADLVRRGAVYAEGAQLLLRRGRIATAGRVMS